MGLSFQCEKRKKVNVGAWANGWERGIQDYKLSILPPKLGTLSTGECGSHLCAGKSFVEKFNMNS